MGTYRRRVRDAGRRHAERLKECNALDRSICVARMDGQLAALNNECPHYGAPLSDGAIEDGRVVCAWHGWSFDPKTGAELRILWAQQLCTRCASMVTMCCVRSESNAKET